MYDIRVYYSYEFIGSSKTAVMQQFYNQTLFSQRINMEEASNILIFATNGNCLLIVIVLQKKTATV